jgi:hypothetical protein
MRVYLRDQIIDILDTVREGIDHLVNSGASIKTPVLEDCEGALMMVLSVLEEHLSKSRYETYLKQVTEIVEKLYNTAKKGEALLSDSEIKSKLDEIEILLHNEAEVKYEAVFLPFKASLWDSMEKMWQTVIDDPEYNVIVVPIPYYYANPVGSQSNMHYEGNMLPPHVPILFYMKYDIVEHKPDVVFLHDPSSIPGNDIAVDLQYSKEELKRNNAGRVVLLPIGEYEHES